MTDIDWSQVEHHLRCRYTDINVVGQGGMGRAYKVKDKSGAVKVVKTTSIPDDKYMQAEYDFLVYKREMLELGITIVDSVRISFMISLYTRVSMYIYIYILGYAYM